FFFQAEDGIRDKLVTGVQTCALPIYLADIGRLLRYNQLCKNELSSVAWLRALPWARSRGTARRIGHIQAECRRAQCIAPDANSRSEERRVGKECRYRWWP